MSGVDDLPCAPGGARLVSSLRPLRSRRRHRRGSCRRVMVSMSRTDFRAALGVWADLRDIAGRDALSIAHTCNPGTGGAPRLDPG
jgi:hypothetical protein